MKPAEDGSVATLEQEPTPNQESQLATQPDRTVSTYVEGEDIDGEITSRDVKYSRINVVQKVGELSDNPDFSPGAIILGKEVVIAKPNGVLTLIALKAQKSYQEQLPFGCGVTPRLFKTAEEVRIAGLSLEWGAPARAAEILNVLFWIPQPAGIDAPHLFSMEGPEGPGTIAGFTAARTAYGTVGKALIGASKTFLTAEKGGLRSTAWEMYCTLEKRESNSWYLPRIRPAARTSVELSAYLATLLS